MEKVLVKCLTSDDENAASDTCRSRQLSDLAAMRARPGWAFVSLAVDPARRDPILDVARGLQAIAERTGTQIVGGDTVRSLDPLVINVALVGETDPACLLRREAARPGDLVAVTGRLGASRGVHYTIDISDQLTSEASHLARASGVGIEIDVGQVPLAPPHDHVSGGRSVTMGGLRERIQNGHLPTDTAGARDQRPTTQSGRPIDTMTDHLTASRRPFANPTSLGAALR